MTLPNLLTISRVPLMFVVVGLMYADFAWCATIAFWLYIAAALTDWLDGLLARRANQVSAFGRFMDAVIDKAMVLGLMVALINDEYFVFGGRDYKIAAMLLLLCIICREFAVSGMRMAAAMRNIAIEADAGGKFKTFIQLNAIGWLLGARMFSQDFGDLFTGDQTMWINGVHGIGLLLYVASAILTVTSGWSYFRRHGYVVMD
ncbi:MAG: CDP-diacylglycerol--glycerol-3-phosphate 3-phosphatidyltransferase [Candidatus Didemnitutus sp.]|nr:CDP-diacylglycerol--glycerol-3-phosphate 3-phosphatidyltransferase [Candidatus Didemnitutus sp.]